MLVLAAINVILGKASLAPSVIPALLLTASIATPRPHAKSAMKAFTSLLPTRLAQHALVSTRTVSNALPRPLPAPDARLNTSWRATGPANHRPRLQNALSLAPTPAVLCAMMRISRALLGTLAPHA